MKNALVSFAYVYHLHEGMEDIYWLCKNGPKPLNLETFERLGLLGSFKDFKIQIDVLNRQLYIIPVEKDFVIRKVKRQRNKSGGYVKGNTTMFNLGTLYSFVSLLVEVNYENNVYFIYDHRKQSFMLLDKNVTWNDDLWLFTNKVFQ